MTFHGIDIFKEAHAKQAISPPPPLTSRAALLPMFVQWGCIMNRWTPIWCWLFILLAPALAVLSQTPRKELPAWKQVLRDDSRLKAALKFKFTGETNAEEVFGKMTEGCGVNLTLANPAERGQVLFGQVEVFHTPVWKVLELLADTQFENGKWEKEGDGYMLHGKPRKMVESAKPPGIKNAKPIGDQATSPAPKAKTNSSQNPLTTEPPPHPRRELDSWQVTALIVIGVVFAAAVALVGLFFWWQRAT